MNELFKLLIKRLPVGANFYIVREKNNLFTLVVFVPTEFGNAHAKGKISYEFTQMVNSPVIDFVSDLLDKIDKLIEEKRNQ